MYAECTYRKPLSGSALEQNTRHLQAAQLARCGCSTPALLRDCSGLQLDELQLSTSTCVFCSSHTTAYRDQSLAIILSCSSGVAHFALPLKSISCLILFLRIQAVHMSVCKMWELEET